MTISVFTYALKNLSQLNKDINGDLDKIGDWIKGNKLSLNVAKTHSMLIVSQRQYNFLRDSNVRFGPKTGSNEIDVHNEAKYLGVQIDKKLKWKEYTKVLSAKVSRAVGCLKYSKGYIPIAAVKVLYISLTEPHFLCMELLQCYKNSASAEAPKQGSQNCCKK